MSTRPTLTADVDVDDSTVTVRGTVRSSLPTLPSFDVTEAVKPLYAYVGALDLALAQAKEVPAEVTSGVQRVSSRLADIPAQVRTLPTSVKGLRSDVEVRVEKVTERASDLYTQLSVRGERLITSIRRQPATEVALEEGKEAVRKVEAAAVAAKKSAKAGQKAAEGAAAQLG